MKNGLELGQTGDQFINEHLCSTYSVPGTVLSIIRAHVLIHRLLIILRDMVLLKSNPFLEIGKLGTER